MLLCAVLAEALAGQQVDLVRRFATAAGIALGLVELLGKIVGCYVASGAGFPLEIIQQILGHVDMETLLNFRFVSRRGSQVTQSLQVWKTIEENVPFFLPLLLKKKTSTASLRFSKASWKA